MMNIQPLPADVRAAYVARRTELARVMREIEIVQRQLEKFDRTPRKPKPKASAAPPTWYRNEPDPILKAGGRAGRAVYPELFKTEIMLKKHKWVAA